MAIWLDKGSRYMQARWSGTKAIPFAVSFWYCTDVAQQVIYRNSSATDNRDYIEIGIDSSGYPYIECGHYKSFPTPTVQVGRATSTVAMTRNVWFHGVFVANGYADRYLYHDGANYVQNTTSVQGNAQAIHHWGCSVDKDNGAASPTECYPVMTADGTGLLTPDEYARGYLADFCIWQGAGAGLSATQAAELYNTPMPAWMTNTPYVLHYLPFYGGNPFDDLLGASVWATAPYLINRRWGLLRLAGQPADGDQFTLDTQQYTYKTTLTGAAYEIKIGLSLQVTWANTGRAIMNTGTPGTDYGTGTSAHTTCWGGAVELGNNKDRMIVCYEMDPGSGSAPALTIDTSTSGNLYAEKIDGTTITALADADSAFDVQRSQYWWDNTGAPEDGVGPATHAHNPPKAIGYPVTIW